MNLSSATLAGNSFRPATKRPLLPKTATFQLSDRLNWVIRQRLKRMILYSVISGNDSFQKIDDLGRLDTLLRQSKANQRITLYGFELSTLYSFLLAQNRQYAVWSPGLVPDWASRALQADIRGILPHLRAICRRVDMYADRPIHAR